MVVSAILVVAPIVAAPQVQYFYVLLFILAGLIFYVPFVYYKKRVPGMGEIYLVIMTHRWLQHFPALGFE